MYIFSSKVLLPPFPPNLDPNTVYKKAGLRLDRPPALPSRFCPLTKAAFSDSRRDDLVNRKERLDEKLEDESISSDSGDEVGGMGDI